MHRQMLIFSALFAGIPLLPTSLGAQAQEEHTSDAASTAIQRPQYSFMRSTEDWSILRGATDDQMTDIWDPIKYVPLTDDGDVWASFGGHTRFRFEGWSDFAFGAPADADDSFLLWRLTMHADIHVGDNVRAFIEGKTALSTDRDLPDGRRTLDVDTLALEQAFVDVTLQLDGANTIILRGGRQVYAFGKQRLVSPLPWANTLRRWDGITAIANINGCSITGFWSQFAPVQKYEFNDSDSDTQFFGIYATGTIPDTDISLDLYYLGLDRDGMIMFNGTTGDETRHTIGGRLFGTCGDSSFDYDVEGAYQFGTVGSDDVSAYMFGGQLGFTPDDMRASPRFFVGVDYASGDNSPGGDVETFNQLFPLGHAYFGSMDFIGRQNAIDLNIGVTGTPFERTTVQLSGHYFLRADNDDALYNAGGGIVRTGALSDDREIGVEIDVVGTYKLDAHTTLEFGYSHFFAGDFIEESGSGDDMDFVYAQITYVF